MTPELAKLKREHHKAVKAYYNGLTFADCKKTPLVTDNQKLRKTGEHVCGIALYPAFMGLTCCFFASCLQTCIGFTGLVEVCASKHAKITHVEKSMLRRTWLFINQPDYFYKRINRELSVLLLDSDAVHFREISSECLDYTQITPDVISYGYFKNPSRMESLTGKGIYSWSERSTQEDKLLAIQTETPVSVVVGVEKFADTMQGRSIIRYDDNTIYIDGNESDLASYNAQQEYDLTGYLVIHLLRYKTPRGGKAKHGQTAFLDSWQSIID